MNKKAAYREDIQRSGANIQNYTRGETCYTTAPFIVKTTNKAEAHVPHTAGPLKRVVVVSVAGLMFPEDLTITK